VQPGASWGRRRGATDRGLAAEVRSAARAAHGLRVLARARRTEPRCAAGQAGGVGLGARPAQRPWAVLPRALGPARHEATGLRLCIRRSGRGLCAVVQLRPSFARACEPARGGRLGSKPRRAPAEANPNECGGGHAGISGVSSPGGVSWTRPVRRVGAGADHLAGRSRLQSSG